MALGELIRRARVARNYSQGKVAREAGVSRAWISRVESGQIAEPEAKLLRAIAPVILMDPEELFIAFGYSEKPMPLDSMTLDDLMFNINKFLAEIKRRTLSNTRKVSPGPTQNIPKTHSLAYSR